MSSETEGERGVAAPNRFVERLRTGPPIVGDGGMGALVSSAVPRLRTPEEANIRAPDAVVSLHVGFIRAGAELIETNTFGANRRKLARHLLEDEFEAINSAAVRLAREAREVTGSNVFIAGSIGPLGDLGDVWPEERAGLFAEQATILEGRGADLFMIETFFDLEELVVAVEAVRGVSSLPIVGLMTFENEAETLAGVSAQSAAEKLRELDVTALGANHGAGLQAALRAIEQMGGDGVPLAALPNIGLASMAGGRVIYPHASPEYFAEFAAHARNLGAKIIGGCCGTTPAEIAAIRGAVDEAREPRAPLVFAQRDGKPLAPQLTEKPLTFKRSLSKAGKPITQVCFPDSGVCSIMSVMRGGAVAEVGTVGNEGVTGLALFYGDARRAERIVDPSSWQGTPATGRRLSTGIGAPRDLPSIDCTLCPCAHGPSDAIGGMQCSASC